MTISILIVEDDLIFLDSLVQTIAKAPDLNLAGIAKDLPHGLLVFEQVKPDVLLVDIGLPSGCGIDLIRKAHETLPSCAIMVITVFDDERHVLSSIDAGATGYLLKDSKDMEIIAQIRSLHEGGSPISPIIARQLLTRFKAIETKSQQASTCEPSTLSNQELTVLEMSAKGYSYEETAQLLKLSSRTIQTYVKRIYRKLQVHSKSEAIYEARKLGLIQD